MENALNRECYSLSAGLALGLVMLEVGSSNVHGQISFRGCLHEMSPCSSPG